MSNRSALTLASPLGEVKGIGPERAALLARLELKTVEDLLLHRPRRYEDRRLRREIKSVELGEMVSVQGQIVAHGTCFYKMHTKSMYEFILDDGTGRLHCRWYNCEFMEKQFKVGNEVLVFGRISSVRPRTMKHPETEMLDRGDEIFIHHQRVAPIYPLTEGLGQRGLRALIWRVLGEVEGQIVEPWPVDINPPAPPTSATAPIVSEKQPPSLPMNPPHPLPLPQGGEGEEIGAKDSSAFAIRVLRPQLPSRREAIRHLHFPDELADAELARQRLAVDELIDLQINIQTRRRRLQANAKGLSCAGDNHLIKPFLHNLGFTLTDAQTRVLREIRQDVRGVTCPMRRLLQGDVGSGKTVVAACSALMALESGFNVLLMAPTEILAEQHYKTFSRWFAPLGLPVHLQTGSKKTLEDLGTGDRNQGSEVRGRETESSAPAKPNPLTPTLSPKGGEGGEAPMLVIGTHALVESKFELDHVGLVIIDEQHKFGVAQRESLVRKGNYPHLLVMTATPIPRTLGLTLYGDLDISIIDQYPAGRGRIRTYVRTQDKLPKVWEFIRKKLEAGEQAYVVYPRVEETDLTRGAKAVKQEFERMRKALEPWKAGLLHGRLSPEEKESVMTEFRENRVHVLLATTVIEVGLDVPNATVMLVENADQFGLAQLHQLRGRIGRGAKESYCILMATEKTDEARDRLHIMEETNDGFRIAEADLLLRGPGELLGQDQSGCPTFRFADLKTDLALVEKARDVAKVILDRNGPEERV